MSQFWNPQIIRWYEEAMQWNNYPQSILGEIFHREILESDTVLDAGSGIGAISLYVASFCKKVKAVDSQSGALKILREKAQKLGVQNVETYLGRWPDVDVGYADVAICTYSPPISRNISGLQKLIDVTKRTGIILTPNKNMHDNNKVFSELASILGIQRKSFSCSNGCWEKGFLESKGVKLQCSLISHDFSQPVSDYGEAWNFIRNQLDAPEHTWKRGLQIIPDYLDNKNGRFLIPIIRENCLIIFSKQQGGRK